MLFAVLFEDNDGFGDIRPKLMPDHLAFLERNASSRSRASGATPEPLETYGRERRQEWRTLLGLEAGVRTGSATADWVRRRRNRIVPCIPASGVHLEHALRQIGLELTS